MRNATDAAMFWSDRPSPARSITSRATGPARLDDADLAARRLRMQLAWDGYDASRKATARLRMPSLVDFLA